MLVKLEKKVSLFFSHLSINGDNMWSSNDFFEHLLTIYHVFADKIDEKYTQYIIKQWVSSFYQKI